MIAISLLSCFCLVGRSVASFRVHNTSFTPSYVLVATLEQTNISCQTRSSVLFNGTFPGPTIVLPENRTTWIRVYNKIPDQNLTVHWHGLSQRTAPFSDGTPLVSQWPIPSGFYFDYEIKPEIGDAGTYFYHSHVGLQLSTAHGALIVQDQYRPPFNYHDEKTFVMSDFYAATDEQIVAGLDSDPFRWSGEPLSISINGRSGKQAFNGSETTCNPLTIDVEPGKLYRIRVIGATILSMVKIGIEAHSNLRVIEADGAYTTIANIDHIQVAPGQRFSFILATKSIQELQALNRTEFWIRYESRDRPTVVSGYALLRYTSTLIARLQPKPKSLPVSSPVILPNTTTNYLEYVLEPHHASTRRKFPRLSEVTRTVVIQVNQMLLTGQYVNGTLNGSLVWVQNGSPWQENVQARSQPKPYLIETYVTGQATNYTRALLNGGYDPVTKTFPAKIGEVLDIVWQNNGWKTGNFDFHPMHAHGEHYWDLGSGNGTYNAFENEKRFANYTPAKRDTTILYRYMPKGVPQTTAGWRAWRIRVTEDNIGAWMMHCHIAQHSVMGMNTIWIFGDSTAILQKYPRAPYISGYTEYGGSAYGNRSNAPIVWHHFSDKNGDAVPKR